MKINLFKEISKAKQEVIEAEKFMNHYRDNILFPMKKQYEEYCVTHPNDIHILYQNTWTEYLQYVKALDDKENRLNDLKRERKRDCFSYITTILIIVLALIQLFK